MEKKAYDLQLGDVLYWNDNNKAVVTKVGWVDGREGYIRVHVCLLGEGPWSGEADVELALMGTVYVVVDRVTPAT